MELKLMWLGVGKEADGIMIGKIPVGMWVILDFTLINNCSIESGNFECFTLSFLGF